MKNQIFLAFAIFTLFTLQLNAQTGQYVDGYLVTTSGEKIEGKLKLMSDHKSTIKVIIQKEDGEKVKFKSKDIEHYVRGDQKFVSKNYIDGYHKTNQHELMEVLVDGDLKLYKHVYYKRHLTRQDNGKVRRPHFIVDVEEFYVEKDGQYAKVTKSEFQDAIMPFIEDDTKMVLALLKNQYSYDDLEELVTNYNNSTKEDGYIDMKLLQSQN